MVKDIDMMRDTGGTYKHKDLMKPSRSDKKTRELSEKDPDAKDTKRDPDLKLSHIVNKVAKQFKYLYEDKEAVFIGFKYNKLNPEKSLIFSVYQNGYINILSVDQTIDRTLGSHITQLRSIFKLPEIIEWDEQNYNMPLKIKKNHNKKPQDFFGEGLWSLSKHDKLERKQREQFIDDIIQRNGVVFIGYNYNYNKRKNDIYVIYDTGVIQIYGKQNNRVTSFPGKISQINWIYNLPQLIGWDKEKDEPILRKNHNKKPSKKMLTQCRHYEITQITKNDLPTSDQSKKKYKDELIKIRNHRIAKALIKIAESLIF